jgi:hypothetical protein
MQWVGVLWPGSDPSGNCYDYGQSGHSGPSLDRCSALSQASRHLAQPSRSAFNVRFLPAGVFGPVDSPPWYRQRSAPFLQR